MSPFNVSLAFDSPLLEDVNSATGAKGVVREMGGTQLKFGVVDQAENSTGLDERHGEESQCSQAEEWNTVSRVAR